MDKKWVMLRGPKGDFLLNLDNVTHANDNGSGKVNIYLVGGDRVLFNGSLDDFEIQTKQPS